MQRNKITFLAVNKDFFKKKKKKKEKRKRKGSSNNNKNSRSLLTKKTISYLKTQEGARGPLLSPAHLTKAENATDRLTHFNYENLF